MADKRDYYEVLGVDKTADEKEIKKAYRHGSRMRALGGQNGRVGELFLFSGRRKQRT